MAVKISTTFEQQIEILKKRGCLIKDEEYCKEKLSLINYYRLSAYFLSLKNKDKFKEGTTFEKIYALYEFDRKLRSILFSAIEVIEITLRSRLTYYHATNYGSLGYLKKENFSKNHNEEKFKKNIDREIQTNSSVPFVKHHVEKYNSEFPIWVIGELFTFGMLSYFYSDLTTHDKKEISNLYNANYKDMISWLRCCTDLRNICAHYGRIYNRVFSSAPSGFDLNENDKRKLWGELLVLKSLYPSAKKWNTEIVPKLYNLFDEYKEDIELQILSFPNDWEEKIKK